MKKLIIGSLLTAVAVFGLSAAEPIGIDLGLDIGIYGFESDIGVALDPSITYNRTVAGIDASVTLDYAFPIYEEYVDGVIGLELYGSKSFALSDTLNLVPGLTIAYAYDTNAEDDESSFGIEPEATLEFGNYYALLSLPQAFVPDSATDIYLELGAGFGELSAYVSGDYAIAPDAQLASIGFGVEYPFGAWTFGADGELSGFGDEEDVVYGQTLSVTYSF